MPLVVQARALGEVAPARAPLTVWNSSVVVRALLLAGNVVGHAPAYARERIENMILVVLTIKVKGESL